MALAASWTRPMAGTASGSSEVVGRLVGAFLLNGDGQEIAVNVARAAGGRVRVESEVVIDPNELLNPCNASSLNASSLTHRNRSTMPCTCVSTPWASASPSRRHPERKSSTA